MRYSHKIVRGQVTTQQNLLEEETIYSSNGGIYIGDQPYNTLKTIFSHLTTLGHKIEENERTELLLQTLPYSYNQLIMNLTNNNPADNLIFDDVAAFVLNEENRRKNKENRQANSQQVEALAG